MLGLLVASNPGWASRAADDLPTLLVDHAHCEMKAASNALALSARAVHHPHALRVLAGIAEDELSHFRRVLELCDARGVPLAPPLEDFYAAELLRRANASAERRGVRDALSDRLLVGALIEARSCERFKLLATELGRRAESEGSTSWSGLAAFYTELLASEARHHRVFAELAEEVSGDRARTETRLAALGDIEADIVRGLPGGATIHG